MKERLLNVSREARELADAPVSVAKGLGPWMLSIQGLLELYAPDGQLEPWVKESVPSAQALGGLRSDSLWLRQKAGSMGGGEVGLVQQRLRSIADALEKAAATSPTSSSSSREKHQKFGVLDAPHLLAEDLTQAAGLFGMAALYLDLDDFKSLNTRFGERVIDRTVLPQLHALIARASECHGHAYAEGGDEVVVLLSNATESMAVAFAEALLQKLRDEEFLIGETTVRVTASAGLACHPPFDRDKLPDAANEMKAKAKKEGKNRVVVARQVT